MEQDQLNNQQELQRSLSEIVVRGKQETKPTRILRPVCVSPASPRHVDTNAITFEFYDAFNYSLLSVDRKDVRMTLGVTSANRGEGKTLVASNLAVSLAVGHEKKTVIVDLNFQRPQIDRIFGTGAGPGLIEALKDGNVVVFPTQYEQLFVLPVGGIDQTMQTADGSRPRVKSARRLSIGMKYLPSFKDVLYSLEQEFECVIVDMPAVRERDVPILFAGQLDGLLVVIDTKRTQKADLERMFRVVNDRQVVGFVFNRVREED
ncbi:MAG TPA: CpsD/CapB family tyrosine-protein kinase [Bacteroidota bacterium]|nr:CpsD/CapB family tyrosine-protein kinase [Bacteroidota bacterium]